MPRNAHRSLTRVMRALLMLLTVSAGSAALADPAPKASDPTPRKKVQVQEAYGNLPLSFEANQGQTDRQVQFLSRGPGYTLFLTQDEAVLALRSREASLVKREAQALSPESSAPTSENSALSTQHCRRRRSCTCASSAPLPPRQ